VECFKKLEEVMEEHQIKMENIYNMDETGIGWFYNADIGFRVSTSQASFIVVNSCLRQKYQAEPGCQEWVAVVECICADGDSISPLVIFKGENLLTSWIPHELQNNWHFSCNTKTWTSNIHGKIWWAE